MENKPTNLNSSGNRLFARQFSIGYDYIENIDVSSVNWVAADENVRALEIRVKTSGNVRVSMGGSLGTLMASDYDIFQGEFESVNKIGTDAGLQTGEITVFGMRIQESTPGNF